MNFAKLNRSIHRDLGYLFFAMTIIYGISGISLNHIKDWNPNYIVENQIIYSDLIEANGIDKTKVLNFLATIGEENNYKKYYYPSSNQLKIFINNGSILVDINTGEAQIERLTRRPVFNEFNWFHYNYAKRLFTWFSDIFAIALILMGISGLFMVKGKNGITQRGAWLTVIGILIPIIFYIMYN